MHNINNNVETVEIKIPYDTEIFGENINFNPSIVLIDTDTFLMSFFTFRRHKEGHPKHIQPQPSIYDDYHMYKGGINSDTWWDDSHGGYRGTGYLILKIINREVIIHQILDDLGLGYDARLTQTPKGILLTQSGEYFENFDEIWGIDRVKNGLAKRTCKENCDGVYYLFLSIYHDKYIDTYKLSENANWYGEPMCPKLQDQDKNWSPFIKNKNIYVSNWLTPKHTVVIEKYCKIIKEPNFNIFYISQLFYNNTLSFRLGTPAIKFNNNEMIAVGHVRFFGDFIPVDSKAYSFYKENILPKHPYHNLMYMMFIYTFDINTFEILRVSPAFYPPNIMHSVVFPVGLTYHDDDYVISYGEGDIKMKLLFMKSETINDLLYDQNDIDHEYEFIYLGKINKRIKLANKNSKKSTNDCCSHLMKPHTKLSILYCEHGCGHKINL